MIDEPPALYTWLESVYACFWKLSRQRGTGFRGPEKLGVTDIFAFYEVAQPCEDREEFYEFITAMDDLFLKECYKMIKAQTPSPGGPVAQS